MDILELKLLAGRTRDLLSQHDVALSHAQSLDLIAALPGLRSWPEVQAFPKRIDAFELESAAIARLGRRVNRKFKLEFDPAQLMRVLLPDEQGSFADDSLAIWPAGPGWGVYLTDSQSAIDALLQQYDEATDGELVYAESAGSNWASAIELGDWGLSSSGFDRVPSGTLIVVGPIELTQQDWSNSAEKLAWACHQAQLHRHRVAVLIDSPQPEQLLADAEIAVRQVNDPDIDTWTALVGMVSEAGDLVATKRQGARTPVVVSTALGSSAALPPRAVALLSDRFRGRPAGLVLLSSSYLQEHWGIEQIAAALPLTDAVGPIARIKPRARSTPAKDMLVPDIVKGLPIMPSIESAYASGYRRMIVSFSYTKFETIEKYAHDVLFFMGTPYFDSIEAVFAAVPFDSRQDLEKVYRTIVASVGVVSDSASAGQDAAIDVFLPDIKLIPKMGATGAIQKQMLKQRAVRWEDELRDRLDRGLITPASLEHTLTRRAAALKTFLALWKRHRKSPDPVSH